MENREKFTAFCEQEYKLAVSAIAKPYYSPMRVVEATEQRCLGAYYFLNDSRLEEIYAYYKEKLEKLLTD